MNFTLTEEQNIIIEKVLDPKTKLIQIDAVAGASKSFTLVQCAKAINKKGRYLAFNKAIVIEANQSFKQTDTEVITTNAIAFRYVCTQGLVDNKTARTRFKQITRMYLPDFTLDKQYTQEYLEYHTADVLPERTDDVIVHKIQSVFEDFIHKKRQLNVYFNLYEIREDLEKETKKYIITLLLKYFNSKHIELKPFLEDCDEMQYYKILKKYILKMINKEIGVPFAFNLKYYHILLKNKTINEPKLDILMLDESSDSSEVVLESFKLVPAHLKIMVGDVQQSINSFADSTNGFDYFKDKGELLHLTQSFRCSIAISKQIQQFGREQLDPDFKFEGFDRPKPDIITTGYLSRTNSGLIKTMMELHSRNLEYKLVRSVKAIFGLIKTLCYISPKGKIFNEQYGYLEQDIKDYNHSPKAQEKSLLSFVKAQHHDNVEIQSAISNINKLGRNLILNTMEHALRIEKKKRKSTHITLASVHSVKGRAWTEVHVNDDLYLQDIIDIPFEARTLEEQESLRLLYVAYSRCTHTLINAHHLKEI
ncbi:MAG: hypothetical protein KAI79_02370 [Bacteroidales bacterium]|nr:hypothetical protein [Bacteroidales bacterium]